MLFQAPDGSVSLDVRLEQDTIWLSLNQLADLFARDKSVVSRHLRNVYREGELKRAATVAKFATVQTEEGIGGRDARDPRAGGNSGRDPENAPVPGAGG